MFQGSDRPGSSVRDLRDLMAIEDYEGELLTGEELSELVGIQPDEEGNVPGIDMYNACMSIQSNPRYQALPDSERVKALATAATAMGNIWPGH